MAFFVIYGALHGWGVAVAPIIDVPIPRITQLRAWGAFTGKRYGSFAGKLEVTAPDFMHGTIVIQPYIVGDLQMRYHLSGKISVTPHLNGDIRTNP